MIRRIIRIDEDKCDGCGLCAAACHEGAIGMVDGKAKLLRDDYCDGLGDCLPACPAGAIRFEQREAAAYNEAAVLENKRKAAAETASTGCAGSRPEELRPSGGTSCLSHWPVQLKLVPAGVSWLDGADLLIAADCTAYAYSSFHDRFMDGRVTLIGCPKLDQEDYAVKLTQIFSQREIRSITVVRMEVPCCGGLVSAVQRALAASQKAIPLDIVTISVKGNIQK